MDYGGWPGGPHISVAGAIGEPHFEPINEPARRIFAFYTRNKHMLGFPSVAGRSADASNLPARDAAARFPLKALAADRGRCRRLAAYAALRLELAVSA
jgi:hypothetical protein